MRAKQQETAGRDSACPERGVTGSKMQGPRELRRRRCPESQVKRRDKPSAPAGSPTSSKPVIPEPQGTHSQAGTSSRKSAFCVRSRCRSCRTMWRFQTAAGAQGSQGAAGPAMAAESLAAAHGSCPSRRGGASRGLHDVRTAAAGNPRAVPSAFVGEIRTPQSRCCWGPAKTFSPKGVRFCPRGVQRGMQPP